MYLADLINGVFPLDLKREMREMTFASKIECNVCLESIIWVVYKVKN